MHMIEPLFDRVIVKRTEQETSTKGGILLPPTAQSKSPIAEVCYVGAGRETNDGTLIPLKVKVGDKVLLSTWGGDELNLGGEKLLVIKESDILAKITN